MALHSYVLAMGELNGNVVDCLERPPRYYRDAPRGCFVFARLFQCTTTTMSRRMAKACRVDPEDPSTYAIDPRRVRRWKLNDTLEQQGFCFVEDWLIFEKLRDNGFLFFFRPEP